MRLLDQIMHAAPNVTVSLPGRGTFQLPGAAARAAALAVTPLRYVLGDGVRALCTQILTEWPDLLDPADPALRLPVERLWMEWNRPASPIVLDGQSQPCGVLVEADATGRRGRIESFWAHPIHGTDRAQVQIEFDFDRPIGGRTDGRRTFAMPAACSRALARHARISADPGWLDYFSFTSARHGPVAMVIARCAESCWQDLPMLLAFCRLMAARPEIRETPIERARLNAARTRAGKPPLLDHLELALALGAEMAPERLAATAHGRAQARLHLVRGHMVNRRGALFWRSSHLRGRPDSRAVQSRTVSVSLAAGHTLESSGL